MRNALRASEAGDEDELEAASCAVCGAADATPLFVSPDRRLGLPGAFRMVECRECRHVYLDRRPAPGALPRHYPEHYSPYAVHQGALGRVTAFLRRHEARAIRKALPAGARLLEVGCGAGDLLGPLRDLGLEVVGLDVSAHAAAAAREALGLEVQVGELARAKLPPASFDALVMRNVIEHVPDPLADLKRAAALLKPGGRIFIWTDNFDSLDRRLFGPDWHGFDVPRHFNLFTPATLRALLERAGFAPGRVRFTLVPNHWIVSARYRLERRLGASRALAFFSLKNPVLLAALLPVTATQSLLGNGGRMAVTAVRKPGRSDEVSPRRLAAAAPA